MRRRLRHFLRADKGAATAEFVILFPVVFMLLLVMLELAFLMARATLLQQALEVTMRDVRLGNIVNPTVSTLEDEVCEKMTTVNDCASSMVLEFTQINRATFAMPAPQAPCVRRSVDIMAARAGDIYDTGEVDELMVVRACMVVDPITPVLDDIFELFARTAFVNEPRE